MGLKRVSNQELKKRFLKEEEFRKKVKKRLDKPLLKRKKTKLPQRKTANIGRINRRLFGGIFTN